MAVGLDKTAIGSLTGNWAWSVLTKLQCAIGLALISFDKTATAWPALLKRPFACQPLIQRARRPGRAGGHRAASSAGQALRSSHWIGALGAALLWAQCAECGLMLPKDLTQKSLLRDQPATALPSQCFRCRGARDLPSPKLEDVPATLRGLTEQAARALSPLEVDVGMEQRAKFGLGYRVRSSMLRLRWKAEPVKAAIRALPDRDQRAKAKAARKFLRSNADSAYGEFAIKHEQFRAESPDADQTARRRRLAFLERPGLERALWPALFWNKSMTFSQERASDPRRWKAETLEQAMRPACWATLNTSKSCSLCTICICGRTWALSGRWGRGRR